ncbi:uncharacterized protein [Notothenia coriiceps]|uniref:Myosin motor domain-containing protein n=1 Tax=Notothenia coriiceps TaxID=8208 RepID=A0A6I9NAC7_9TELE|nr:PREDICTED: uncharacterized protein LOC104946993 [Notothenia coriiceps]
MDTPGEEQGGRKVVQVVRRIVRRVVPAQAEGQTQPVVSEPARAAFAADLLPKTSTRSDDISMGLTSLMGRSRTKEHRPRTRTQDRKEDMKEEAKQEEEEKVAVEEKEEKPAVEKTEEATATNPTAPTPASPKVNPLTPPAGFIPAPKPNPLAPPVGFIPLPKQNLLTPPPGFIPARKPSPVPPRQNPLARPPGFVPVHKTDPLAPPAGFIPKPRPVALKKPEVKETSSPSVAPDGKPSPVARPQAQSATNEQVPQLTPSEEDHKRVRRIFAADANDSKLVEDPVAILQAAHSAAAQAKTEEQLTAETAWYNKEKVWLVHKDGFSIATLLKAKAGSLPEGKVKIRLESDGSLLDVDEDDVEKANPPMFDRVEDLASLQYLNESSVMHSLRQRYGGNLVHTHSGPNMVVVNPICAPSMYSEKVMQMFKGCRREDTAPHIYSMAQAAYRNLLTTRQDQSIVLLGKSGSGKTTNCQHIIQYLISVAGSTNKTFSCRLEWTTFGNNLTFMVVVMLVTINTFVRGYIRAGVLKYKS